MQRTIVFDLDGTIADHAHRVHLIEKPPKDYKTFYSKCSEDSVIEWIKNLTYEFGVRLGYAIVILTGRSDSVRDKTETWLREHDVYFDQLIMRPSGLKQPDFYWKLGKLEKLNNVAFIIEDRTRVVDFLRGAGYNVLQCAKGDY